MSSQARSNKIIGHAGTALSAEDVPSPESAVRQKTATGASLPALLLSTAQAVGLGGLQGFSHSVPLELDASGHRYAPVCSSFFRLMVLVHQEAGSICACAHSVPSLL